MKLLIKYSILILSLLIIYTIPINDDFDDLSIVEKDHFKSNKIGDPNISKSMMLYEMIEKYSDIYDIPKHIAYNVAYKETRYKGPFHWNYVPEQGSYAGALGPMQIMPSTGKNIYSRISKKNKGNNTNKITNDDILNDIEINVMISMKLLNRLYKQTGNWTVACGKYNTGRNIINDYALYCSNNKNYKDKWVSLNL